MPITTPDTLFTHDVIGRYLCNTRDEALASGPFDVYVIGGGSFGAAIAEQIFDFDIARRHRILVLEAGPFMLPGHVQNLPPMSAPLGPPDLSNPLNPGTIEQLRAAWSAQNPGQPVPAILPPRNEVWGLAWHSRAGANAADPKDKRFPGLAYCIGGRSLFWGGWSPRLIATELTDWPAAVVTDLNTRLFALAQRQLGTDLTNDFITGPLHSELRARLFANLAGVAAAIGVATADELEAPLAVQSASPLPGFFPFNKFSSLPLLLEAVRADVGRSGNDSQRRLMVVPRCHAISLGLGPNNRVNLIRTNQGDFQVSANAVVFIALGTVESTRLALLSFPNADGHIGQNLMAHLRSNTTIRIPRADLPPNLPNALQASALFVKGQQAANGPHFHLQITGTGVRGDVRDSEIELNQAIPNIDLLDQITGALAQPGGDDFVVVTIRGIGEMTPDRVGNGPSRIQLDPEVDENGVRRAIVTLGLTAADQALWDTMDAAAQQTAQALATSLGGVLSPGLQYLNPGANPPWQAAAFTQRDGLGSTHHEGGTLWMGTDPAASVTDTIGRFHEVTNAFAVGPALFPVVGSPNPMLGGMALVRRTAEALLAPRLPPGPPVLDPGFQWLFSGANTNGWQMAGPGGFQLEGRDGGVMTSNGGPGLFWFSGQQFANFVLRLQWQSNDPNDNSGVFVRFPDPGNNPQVAVDQGYEIQIDDLGQPDNAPIHRTGAIYQFAAPSRLASRLMGEWNDLEIGVQGQNHTVTLNGDQVTTLAGNPGGRPNQGFIGVQNHHPGSRVSFRNIRIQPLP
ncbi:family 16 glycoside hydrolase [Belnapia moabensis]|uniref:family 16 glycoside hydrolase n=1 Tax=Belnapia moabensis TaxID=365533 RepID=UPI0005BC5AA1|nr:family 16 glycoside hydrolase [Belnapia moabensis]